MQSEATTRDETKNNFEVELFNLDTNMETNWQLIGKFQIEQGKFVSKKE